MSNSTSCASCQAGLVLQQICSLLTDCYAPLAQHSKASPNRTHFMGTKVPFFRTEGATLVPSIKQANAFAFS
jgi:hypothetical protein